MMQQNGVQKMKVMSSVKMKPYLAKVSTCGIIVNPKWSWLGFSPNGIVQGQKAIEIKCPSKFKDLDINECCHDNFFMTLKNNKPTLKLNHQYHIQCQGIMAITELTTTDFVVYTQKSMYIQTISFDGEIWEKQYLPDLTFFYFEQNKIFEKKLRYITFYLSFVYTF